MRHSAIDPPAPRLRRTGLTRNAYSDPQLLDIARALDRLPKLPLDAKCQVQKAGTGRLIGTGS